MNSPTNDESLERKFSGMSITGNYQNNLQCETYTTKNNTVVSIDRNKQESGSYGIFHLNYTIISVMCNTTSSIVFIGKNTNGTKVVIKRSQFYDQDHLEDNLIDDMPLEVYIQKEAERFSVEGGKGKVLKVLDWYIYDTYYVIVTEYNENFETLKCFTKNHPDGRVSEEECKYIFLLLSKLVFEMNRAGIFHLDLKPKNVLYNSKSKELKLLDFGHSIDADEDPLIRHICGTDGFITPQQVEEEECYGREVDEWGVAQVLFYCLQGHKAFKDNDDIVEKEVEFEVEVSKESKDFLKQMLMKKVEERLTYENCHDHPWLLNRNNLEIARRSVEYLYDDYF